MRNLHIKHVKLHSYCFLSFDKSFGQFWAETCPFKKCVRFNPQKKNRWPHIPLNNKCCVELVTFVIKMVNLHETKRTPHHLQPLLQTFFVMNCSTVSWVFEMAEVETHLYRQTVMTFNVLFFCSNFLKNIHFTDILGEPTSILSYKRKQSLKMFNLFWRYIWRSRWMI